MTKLVVFDIDRTIYNGSVFLDFSLHLIQKNLISPKFLSSIGFEYVTYQTGFESYDELVRDCLNYFHKEIVETPLDVLKNEIKECLFKNHHKFYDYVFQTLKLYPNYDYLIISLEPDFITEEVASFLKIQNFISNKFTEDNKLLIKPNLIFDKLEFLSKSKFNDQIPFACFGDSESDFELLKKSINKFVIDPTAVLQKNISKEQLDYNFFNSQNIFEEIKSKF